MFERLADRDGDVVRMRSLQHICVRTRGERRVDLRGVIRR